jgi:hypothetical protein
MTGVAPPLLRRYWIEFEDTTGTFTAPRWPKVCGVTAYSLDDALRVIRDRFGLRTAQPGIRQLIEDVDVSTLDAKHVLPNIGVVVWRGVWFVRI